ncbi:hypothetical protein DPMN_119556 [Dreissena polymorpha]|uniref:Uncharacterized protein n=1 Tax=Dreissena polymorpha TaxID=45954 RepID=A0A9D4JMT2_DREPO|nr:hypothetical protein DPMN_119556 [Dreissena polymorpha]
MGTWQELHAESDSANVSSSTTRLLIFQLASLLSHVVTLTDDPIEKSSNRKS